MTALKRLQFLAAMAIAVLALVIVLVAGRSLGPEAPSPPSPPSPPLAHNEHSQAPLAPLAPLAAMVPYAPVRVPRCIEPEECERLIARATRSLELSKTLGDVVSLARTSEQAWVDPSDADVGDIVRKIRTRTGQMTGIYREDLFEQLQVARYNQTQEYKQHYDACVEQCDRDKRERIPRRATMLVYLTDDFEDGYTHFPIINERVRPRRGDAVLFYNSDADTGAEIPDSLHAGEPVRSGTKWIANCWVRYDQSAKRV